MMVTVGLCKKGKEWTALRFLSQKCADNPPILMQCLRPLAFCLRRTAFGLRPLAFCLRRTAFGFINQYTLGTQGTGTKESKLPLASNRFLMMYEFHDLAIQTQAHNSITISQYKYNLTIHIQFFQSFLAHFGTKGDQD